MQTISRRGVLRMFGLGAAGVAGLPYACAQVSARKPNIVIIFTDDQGYADVGCYGAKGFTTPNLDRMAAEGVRFTDFYSASPACSPSRAALLTGCYPPRVGIPGVLGPRSGHGLHPDEVTIGDLLKARGYATACIGKWHLGDHESLMPWNQGFDRYYGLPYSNDMWPWHYAHEAKGPPVSRYPELPFYDGRQVVETNPDQDSLTIRYTEQALRFIETNRERPFFLYLPHSMPHIPLGVSADFAGKAPYGRYGDVIMEIDWSVGQILETLKRFGIEENTWVIYTSDNGPWLPFGTHAGKATPLREGKGTVFEGGMRMPCIMRWPTRIPAGHVCGEIASTIDLLPTIAKLVGAELPTDRVIDGRDVWPLIAGTPGATTPHEAFFYHWPRPLYAVRSGKWKLVFPHKHRHQAEPGGTNGMPKGQKSAPIEMSLFDLENDIGETTNLADRHPEVVARLKRLAEAHEADLKANSRPAARVKYPPKPPNLVGPGKDGLFDCQAIDAKVHGGGEARYVGGDRRNIGMWHQVASWVSWQVKGVSPGRYQVVIVQSVGPGQEGSEYDVVVDGKAMRGITVKTKGWGDHVEIVLGEVDLPGKAQLTVAVKPVTIKQRALMNLRAIRLVPVPARRNR